MHLHARDLYNEISFIPKTKEVEKLSMKTQFEILLNPHMYMTMGDKIISNPPIINTSLSELAKMGWMMYIDMNLIPSPMANFYISNAKKVNSGTHIKTKISFYNPKNKSERFSFKFWDSCSLNFLENMNYIRVLDFIHNRELKPGIINSYNKLWVKSNSETLSLDTVLQNFSITEILDYVNSKRAMDITLPREDISLDNLDEDTIENLILDFPFYSSIDIKETLQEKIEDILQEAA